MVTPTQTKQSPKGMQSPAARLTTADPTMPRARRAPGAGRGQREGPALASVRARARLSEGPTAKSSVSGFNSPKQFSFCKCLPELSENQKSTSFEVWQEPPHPQISFSLFLYFPYRQASRKQRLEKMKVNAKY